MTRLKILLFCGLMAMSASRGVAETHEPCTAFQAISYPKMLNDKGKSVLLTAGGEAIIDGPLVPALTLELDYQIHPRLQLGFLLAEQVVGDVGFMDLEAFVQGGMVTATTHLLKDAPLAIRVGLGSGWVTDGTTENGLYSDFFASVMWSRPHHGSRPHLGLFLHGTVPWEVGSSAWRNDARHLWATGAMVGLSGTCSSVVTFYGQMTFLLVYPEVYTVSYGYNTVEVSTFRPDVGFVAGVRYTPGK